MTERIVTTEEVGSWMQDLGAHFSEIIEDRSGKRVRPAAIDENGIKWTYERIEEVTGIPTRTAAGMVRKARSGNRVAGAQTGSPLEDRTRVAKAASRDPQAVVAGISTAPRATRRQIEDELRRQREAEEAEELAREEDDMRARGANPDFVEPFDGELAGEAVLIAQVIDGARHRVHRLLDRAEPDQRPPLIATVLKAYDRLGQALDAGSVKVPDYVPEDL